MFKELTDTGFKGIAYANVDDTFRSIPVPYEFKSNIISVNKEETKYKNKKEIETYVDKLKMIEAIQKDLLAIHSKTDVKGNKVGPLCDYCYDALMHIPIEYEKQK